MFDPMIVFGQLDDVMKTIRPWLGDLLKYAIIVVVLVVIFSVLKKLLTKKKEPLYEEPTDRGVDVRELGNEGPPMVGPVLELRNIPVRLAAVILAPAGRIRPLPPTSELGDVFDSILPDLEKVVAAHRPIVRCWQPHVSIPGFAHSVFRLCPLPGDGGKGTPWSTLAGVFEIDGQSMMAGMIMRAERPNSLAQEIIESEGQWRARLQIKLQ